MGSAELHAKQWYCGRRRAASLLCASATTMTRRACKWMRLVGARCTFTRFNLFVRRDNYVLVAAGAGVCSRPSQKLCSHIPG